jgi:hypothetical protein
VYRLAALRRGAGSSRIGAELAFLDFLDFLDFLASRSESESDELSLCLRFFFFSSLSESDPLLCPPILPSAHDQRRCSATTLTGSTFDQKSNRICMTKVDNI